MTMRKKCGKMSSFMERHKILCYLMMKEKPRKSTPNIIREKILV